MPLSIPDFTGWAIVIVLVGVFSSGKVFWGVK